MGPEVEFSPNNYVEYRHGNSNVILSVSHGGGLKPKQIPDRDAGALVDGICVYNHDHNLQKDPVQFPVRYKKDMNTMELAEGVADEFHRITGQRAHVIINHLYRGKMDPNCDREKGGFCVPLAEEAWTAYHTFIEKAQAACSTGLLLDIHGQVHSEDWVELGYTLTKNHLNSGEYTPEMTSVYNLSRSSRAPVADITDLIYGELSFGALLAAEGYKVVPSPSFNSPGEGKYYTGGFITEMHGSKNGGNFDAIQVEAPSSLRTTDRIFRFSQTLAHVIHNFVKLHYGNSGGDS